MISAAGLVRARYPILTRAVGAAGLAPLLAGPGPLTLFAPDEAAWARLAPGVLDALLRPENRGSLVALLRFHLVPGRIDFAELRRRAAGGLPLPTLAGEPLTVRLEGNAVVLSDASGHRAAVSRSGQPLENGIAYDVDTLLTPKALGPQRERATATP